MVSSWSWLYNDGTIWEYILSQGKPKPLKRQVHRKKTEFYPKTQVFWISQFSISALSHTVFFFDVKNQQCSHQHAASVLCRAWLETLLGNYSYISHTTLLRQKCSDKQWQFLHTRSIHNNLNCVFAQNISRWASDPFSHEICPRKDHHSGP